MDTFDVSRLAKPSDWAALDDDSLESSMAELSSGVDAAFEEAKRELAAEKAAKKAAKKATKKQLEGPASSKIEIVDTHVHLWSKEELPPWLAGDAALASIALDRTIVDYTAEVSAVTSCVYMEVDVAPKDRAREAAAIVRLCADPSNRLRGAVIGAPIVDSSVEEFAAWVSKWASEDAVKGVRQVLHPQPAGTCLRDDIVAKARLAGEANLVFELCMRADDLASVAKLAAAAPATRLVLDHCGGHHQLTAASGAPMRDAWRAGIELLAKHDNVYCKLSGLLGAQGGAEGGGGVSGWTPEDQRETVLWCLHHFRPERLLFGGDWPVCTLSAPIGAWVECCEALLREVGFSAEQQSCVWAKTARHVYSLGLEALD